MPTTTLDNPFELSAVQQAISEVPVPGIPSTQPLYESPTSHMTEAEKAEVARLRTEHPDYADHKDHWAFLLKSYEGGPGYVSSDTLFRHQRENEASYADRKARAAYVNYTAPLVDFVPEYIFAKPPERSSQTMGETFTAFEEDVDRAGTHMNDFMREVGSDARLFGHCWVAADKLAIPDGEAQPLSRQREKELGTDRPYLFIVRPLEILDWNTNRFGRYIYLKRLEIVVEQNGFDKRRFEQYTEWTESAIQISRIDITDPKRHVLLSATKLANPWKTIPFVPVFNRRSKANKDMGTSAAQDIAYQNRSAFNYTSLIEEFLYRQSFNQLAMETDTTLPTIDRQSGEIGTSNVIEYPRGAREPTYVSPPVDPAEFIQAERRIAIQEMFRQAAQDAMSELFGADARSGDAARQSFGRTVPVISRLADSLQHAEVAILKLWAKMSGRVWDGKVAYRDDYGADSVSDLLLQLTTIFRNVQILSPLWVRTEWKRVVRLFDSRIEPEAMAKIIREIDAVSDDDILDLIRKPGGDSLPQPGLPSTANLLQGRDQKTLGTDRRRTMQSGDRSSTKERTPDANKRTNQPKAA